VDEGRKRVLLIAACILAARKLSQYPPEARVPATTLCDRGLDLLGGRIMAAIDKRWPVR